MRFGSHQLQQIRNAIRLSDVIGSRITLTQSGAQFRAPCPFHQEKDPSFYVYPDKNFFICYGCQAKGDIFDFLMQAEGYTFAEAVQQAAAMAGVELAPVSEEENTRDRDRERHRQRLYQVNEAAADYFRERLQETGAAHAREYLKNRQLTEEVLHRYRIGYAPDSWDELPGFLRERGLLEEALELGLVRMGQQEPYAFFRDRIMFPIRDSIGNIRGFSSRLLDAERKEGKYVNSPESVIYSKSHSVYGLHEVLRFIRQSDMVILVEGNIDVLSVAQAGLPPAVAPLGTALTAAQIQVLKKYTPNIWLMFDGDQAGRKATIRSIPLLLEAGTAGRIVLLPDGQDPDSLLREQGTDALRILLDQALPPLDTFLNLTLAPADSPIPERIRSLSATAEIWKHVPPAQRGPYLNQIALQLRMDVQDIRPQLETRKPTWNNAVPDRPPAPESFSELSSAGAKAELNQLFHIVGFLSHHESCVTERQIAFFGEQFHTTPVRDLWRSLAESTGWKKPDPFQATVPPVLLKSYQEIADSMKTIAHPEETLAELTRTLTLHGIRQQILDLKSQLQSVNNQTQGNLADDLWKKIMDLEKRRNMQAQIQRGHS